MSDLQSLPKNPEDVFSELDQYFAKENELNTKLAMIRNRRAALVNLLYTWYHANKMKDNK